MDFSPEELELIDILQKPIKWAEATLRLKDGPFKAHPYQIDIVDKAMGKEQTSNRIVLRWGRRLGKTTIKVVFMLWYCFTHKNAKVLIAAPYDSQIGVIFKMLREFINESPEIRDSIERDTKNPQYIQFKNGSTFSGFTAGTRSGAKGDSMRGQAADWVFLDEMDRFCFAPDSLVMLADGIIKEAKDLTVGDKVFSYENNEMVIGNISHISKREDSLLVRTYFTGGFIETTPDHPMMVLKNGKLTEVKVENITVGDWLCRPLRYEVRPTAQEDASFIDLVGCCFGKKNLINNTNLLEAILNEFPELKNKQLPLRVMQGSDREIATFLRGYFSAEGSINNTHGNISSSSTNHKLSRQIQMLLLRLGIQSTLSEHKSTSSALSVVIADSNSIIRFANTVGFNSEIKSKKLAVLISAKSKHNTRDITRYPADLIRPVAEEIIATVGRKFPGKQTLHDSLKRGVNPTKKSLELVSQSLHDLGYSVLASKIARFYVGVYYVQVKKVIPVENPYGYTVDATVPDTHVLFVNNVLAHNSDDDIDSIAAVALEAPDRIGIWASSTPTGRRGKFYDWCHDKENWTHSHMPSTVNPNWSERAEREFRAILSEEGYKHEVLAEFGEETIGVFKKQYIDRAKSHQRYDYLEKADYPAIRTVGVDWDKYGNASQIVVLEFDANFIDKEGNKAPKFRVINRSEIPMGEFTLDNAVKKIIELNETFNPAFIYIDRGYGEYQLETLHKYGMAHPKTKLHEKVKGFQFGESIPIRDPHNKTVEKKPLKPFMVNQATIIVERDQLILNSDDTLLWKQMENYQMVRMSLHGQPVYTSEDEHALDALMLALLAFSLEYPAITNILQEIHLAKRVVEIPRLKHLDSTFSNNTSRGSESPKLWDPSDPEERRGNLVRHSDKEKQTRALKTISWGGRGTGPTKEPKRRKF